MDLRDYFNAIPHGPLLKSVARRVSDGHVLSVIKAWLNVAELDGPWAVNMHLNGPSLPYIDGKETGERAVAFAVLANENKSGGASFPTDGTRLAVGFSAVEPTPNALNVDLDAGGLAAYEYMVQNQCTVYYRGTARWVGNTNGGTCVRRRPRIMEWKAYGNTMERLGV